MSRILVVDDETKITKLLSDRISREGHDVTALESAEAALPRIERGDIDIILCDLRLGGMDGLELLRSTKQISPHTDFVVMTAYASAATAVEAMKEGAYEYLIKPFQMEEVVLLLRRIQERRDLMTENLTLREKTSFLSDSLTKKNRYRVSLSFNSPDFSWTIPSNKSFPPDTIFYHSAIFKKPFSGEFQMRIERKKLKFEVDVAPLKKAESSETYPDLLVFFKTRK